MPPLTPNPPRPAPAAATETVPNGTTEANAMNVTSVTTAATNHPKRTKPIPAQPAAPLPDEAAAAVENVNPAPCCNPITARNKTGSPSNPKGRLKTFSDDLFICWTTLGGCRQPLDKESVREFYNIIIFKYRSGVKDI